MAREVSAGAKTPAAALKYLSVTGIGNTGGDDGDGRDGGGADDDSDSVGVGRHSRDWIRGDGATQGLRVHPTLYHVRIIIVHRKKQSCGLRVPHRSPSSGLHHQCNNV